jgi:hypothetical protein
MNAVSQFVKFLFDHSFAAFIKADSPASIGRYMLTFEFFTMLLVYWFHNMNPPDTLESVFYATLLYVMGDKFVKPVSALIHKKAVGATTKQENKSAPAQTEASIPMPPITE